MMKNRMPGNYIMGIEVNSTFTKVTIDIIFNMNNLYFKLLHRINPE